MFKVASFCLVVMAVQSVPSMWTGNVTSTSLSIRFFAGVQSVSLQAELACGNGIAYWSQDDALAVGWLLNTPLTLTSDASRWIVDFWGLPSRCTIGISGGVVGRARTLGPEDQAATTVLAFGSCDHFDVGAKHMMVYTHILGQQPDLFIQMGDLHYRDITTPDPAMFLKAYDEVLGHPKRQVLLSQIPMDYTWNDHDFGGNEAGADCTARPGARAAYSQMAPHYRLPAANWSNQGALFHAFTVHRVRVVVMDQNFDFVPSVRLASEEQMMWLEGELRNASYYQLLVLVSPIAFGGTSDGLWGPPGNQRARVLDAMAGQTNIWIVSGDSHMLAYDDGTYHANIPTMSAGPLGNLGSQKGACFTGTGNGLPNCVSYRFIPNQQFGTLTIANGQVRADAYRVSATDELLHVFDVTRDLPFLPVQDGTFDGWENSSAGCSLPLMTGGDVAGWLLTSLALVLMGCLGVHLAAHRGRIMHQRPQSPQWKPILFWCFMAPLWVIFSMLGVGFFITGEIDRTLDAFSASSGLGYTVFFTFLGFAILLAGIFYISKLWCKNCGCADMLFLVGKPGFETLEKGTEKEGLAI